MSPNSSGSTLIWRRSTARTVPSVTGSTYVLPVRLSVTVSVCAAEPFSAAAAPSPAPGWAGAPTGCASTFARSLLIASCAPTCSVGGKAPSLGDGANARGRRRGRIAVRAPPRRARRRPARVVGMQRREGRADAAVRPRCRLRRLLDGPAHEKEQRDQGDLEEQHEPEECPRVHFIRSYTRHQVGTSLQRASVVLRTRYP